MVSEDLELIRDTERRIWGIVKGSGLFGLVSSLVHLEPLDLRLATISFMVVTILGVFGVIIGKNPYVRFQYNEYLLLF